MSEHARAVRQRKLGAESSPWASERDEAQTTDVAPELVDEVLRSEGQPLDKATRSYMEPRFAHDFSRVRIHTDDRAARSAHAVSALAYTVGQDIAFASGEYAPGTDAGQRLLAHELAHVVQQAVAPSLSGAVGDYEATLPPAASAPSAAVISPQALDAKKPASDVGAIEPESSALPGLTEPVESEAGLTSKHPQLKRARISAPSDERYEREADEAAESVLARSDDRLPTDASADGHIQCGPRNTLPVGAVKMLARTQGRLVQRASDPNAPDLGVPLEVAPEPNTRNTASARDQWDRAVGVKIHEFFRKFTEIEVTVKGQKLRVSPPYFVSSGKVHHDTATISRENTAMHNRAAKAFQDVEQTIEKQDEKETSRALAGRSRPKDIQDYLQVAVDRGDVTPADATEGLRPSDLRAWLRTYGIGIDCSGFLTQALNFAMQELKVEGQLEESERDTGDLRGGKGKDIKRVQAEELRPGDIMWHSGHVRLVMSVQKQGQAVEFTTVESNNPKLDRFIKETGQEDPDWDKGPMELRWLYDPSAEVKMHKWRGKKWEPAKDKEVPAAVGKDDGKHTIFGRYEVLEKWEAGHGAPAVEP